MSDGVLARRGTHAGAGAGEALAGLDECVARQTCSIERCVGGLQTRLGAGVKRRVMRWDVALAKVLASVGKTAPDELGAGRCWASGMREKHWGAGMWALDDVQARAMGRAMARVLGVLEGYDGMEPMPNGRWAWSAGWGEALEACVCGHWVRQRRRLLGHYARALGRDADGGRWSGRAMGRNVVRARSAGAYAHAHARL